MQPLSPRLARQSLPQWAIANTQPVQQQVNEMQLVREKVYSMEQQHMALKQKCAQLFLVTPLRR